MRVEVQHHTLLTLALEGREGQLQALAALLTGKELPVLAG